MHAEGGGPIPPSQHLQKAIPSYTGWQGEESRRTARFLVQRMADVYVAERQVAAGWLSWPWRAPSKGGSTPWPATASHQRVMERLVTLVEQVLWEQRSQQAAPQPHSSVPLEEQLRQATQTLQGLTAECEVQLALSELHHVLCWWARCREAQALFAWRTAYLEHKKGAKRRQSSQRSASPSFPAGQRSLRQQVGHSDSSLLGLDALAAARSLAEVALSDAAR